jgi:chorismate mutase
MSDDVNQLREKIDLIDQRILECLVQRIEIVKLLSKKKQRENLPIFDFEREQKLKRRWIAIAEENEIDIGHICRILNEILEISKKTQKGMKILGSNPSDKSFCRNNNRDEGI